MSLRPVTPPAPTPIHSQQALVIHLLARSHADHCSAHDVLAATPLGHGEAQPKAASRRPLHQWRCRRARPSCLCLPQGSLFGDSFLYYLTKNHQCVDGMDDSSGMTEVVWLCLEWHTHTHNAHNGRYSMMVSQLAGLIGMKHHMKAPSRNDLTDDGNPPDRLRLRPQSCGSAPHQKWCQWNKRNQRGPQAWKTCDGVWERIQLVKTIITYRHLSIHTYR